MHFESYPGDRIEWILKEAQTWLQEDHFIDLSITCGEAEGMRFKCHKIMFHQFLKQFLSLEHIEEFEEVVIPHLDPIEFKKYHSDVYGLDNSEVANASAVDVKVKLEDGNESSHYSGENDRVVGCLLGHHWHHIK